MWLRAPQTTCVCLHNLACGLFLFSIMMPTDSSVDQSEVVAELLKELSNHSERVEERKAALCELMRLIRETQLHVWDEHFKTILLLLLETLGDGEVYTEDIYTLCTQTILLMPVKRNKIGKNCHFCSM